MFAADNPDRLRDFFSDVTKLKLPKGIDLVFGGYDPDGCVTLGVVLRKSVYKISLKEVANFLKAKAAFFAYMVSKLSKLKTLTG